MLTTCLYYNVFEGTYIKHYVGNDNVVHEEVFSLDNEEVHIDDEDVILKSEYTKRSNTTRVLWHNEGVVSMLRLGSVKSHNIGGRTLQELSSILPVIETHTMGYDIECDNDAGLNALPLPTDTITYGSIACSCGYEVCYTIYEGTETSIPHVKCVDSVDLARRMHEDINAHRPTWLVGYNNYKFDNLFLSFHGGGDNYLHLPSKSNSGAPTLCYYYPGINNVDLYTYIDARYRSKFPRLSLECVAETLEVGKKLNMPRNDEVDNMLVYNLLDSQLTRDSFRKLNVESEIFSICSVMNCSLYDVVRNATGVMCSSMLSSYAYRNGKYVDWSKCNLLLDEFVGGAVLEPEVGIHSDVVVVDYKSMYPNIMISASISHDNVIVLRNSKPDDDTVAWDDDMNVYVNVGGKIIKFPHNEKCISTQILLTLIDFRRIYGEKNEYISSAIKAATNSVFGSLGFPGSPIYSPNASQSITCIARHMLHCAKNCFEAHGLKIVYGDTDSLFLKLVGEGCVETVVKNALKVFHLSLVGTPFSRMQLAYVNTYDKLVMMRKKMYVLRDKHGKYTTRGVVSRRKDKIGIVVDTYNQCVDTLRYGKRSRVVMSMTGIVVGAAKRILSGNCTLSEISMQVRVNGVSCNKYRGPDGRDSYAPEADLGKVVPYDRTHVMESLLTAIDILVLYICGYSAKFLLQMML